MDSSLTMVLSSDGKTERPNRINLQPGMDIHVKKSL